MGFFKKFKKKKGKEAGKVEESEFKVSPITVDESKLNGKIISRYSISPAEVLIVDNEGFGEYLVNEPPLKDEEKAIYGELMERLKYIMEPMAGASVDLKHIERNVLRATDELGIVEQVKESIEKFKYYIYRNSVSYGVIHVPMVDPRIEDISCVGPFKPVKVKHRDFAHYSWMDTNIVFQSEDELDKCVEKLSRRTGRGVSIAMPYVDASTRDLSRVLALFSREISSGSGFTIRKFPKSPFTVAELIDMNTLTSLMATYLWLLIERRNLILILGRTGAGKTTLLNALAAFIPSNYKIVTCEETRELNLPHDHWQPLHTKESLVDERQSIKLLDLIKLSLRMRPDYIIVGEVRFEEVPALIHAVCSGHSAFTTFHAEGPREAIDRLTSKPISIPMMNLRAIFAFATMSEVEVGGRKVRRLISITEFVSKGESYELREVFRWDPETDSFKPNDVEEMLKKSVRLTDEEFLKSMGWSREVLAEEFERRIKFLNSLVQRKVFSFRDFSREVAKFYSRRRLV